MPLTGIDRRQIVQLANRGWSSERIANDLSLELEAVQAAMPATIMDRLEASEDGWLDLGVGRVFAKLASNPEADGYYIVALTSDNGDVCGLCKAARYRGKCRHPQDAREKFGEGLDTSTTA